MEPGVIPAFFMNSFAIVAVSLAFASMTVVKMEREN